MSWGTCYSGSNNILFDYPPIMNDGRNFSNWYPGAVINENIIKQTNIKSNYDYRQYLINNADKLIKNNQIESCNSCGYCPSTYNSTDFAINQKNGPFLYINNIINNSQPFGYNSDLKNVYLSRNQLQTKMVAPQFIFKN